MISLLQEGEVKFYAPTGEKISSKLPVFYNPQMKLARDVAVEIVRQLKPKNACCLMDASGIRSLRLWKEAGVENITANDISDAACELMEKNFSLNKAKIKIAKGDCNSLETEEGFDYIDLDPFGSPVKFLSSAVSKLKRNGVIAITATDIGCMAGRFNEACMR